MFIIPGVGARTVKHFGTAGKSACTYCNNIVGFQLLKVTTWFTLFFIPLIPYKRRYLLSCPVCGFAYILPKDEFMSLAEGAYYETAVQPDAIKYAGKNETQIAFLKQMEEYKMKQDS